MRKFHSYGPVDCERHFCVPRVELVETCLNHLVDDLEKGGRYFTIWAPRQTGKTWLMREVKKKIESRYPDHFQVGMMSMQGVVMEDTEPDTAFLGWFPGLLRQSLGVDVPEPKDWKSWSRLFEKGIGIFKNPLIIFIDEFDSLPPKVIDRLVTLFRDIYLKRESYMLHGLALIGVRAVLGVGSDRGSPFNVQRSLHVPNFSREEVSDLFRQYQDESGQEIAPSVVQAVFDATRGQPGLVGWFGELLTEKFNPGKGKKLGEETWEQAYHAGLYLEWNNTVLNLVKKARGFYIEKVVRLFTMSDMVFKIDEDWCNYLYLNGIIDAETGRDPQGRLISFCRFSSPFIQERLFNALTDHLAGERPSILALEPLDDLKDVLATDELNLSALLSRYKQYLIRLHDKGINPWKGLPRRTDLHLTEAVGHFHLYAWLREAVGRWCVISPEFPTGNGKVDLHLRCKGKEGIIEVKSYVDQLTFEASLGQAARYAHSMELTNIVMALFVPTRDNEVLSTLSTPHEMEGVRVDVVAIGWG